jgi:polyisoprenoid-binding protein YceI
MKAKLFMLMPAMLVFTMVRAQSVWIFDKNHSDIEFHATHLVITQVTGEFKSFDGKLVSPEDDFSGSDVEFSADISSISTDNEMRDKHLKSDDFFNAEKYPKMNFQGILTKSGEKYKLVGNLTIRDVTKSVTLDVLYRGMVKDPFTGASKAGFKVTGTINRFDYNLKWNSLIEAGGAVVGPEITIECNAELQKQG